MARTIIYTDGLFFEWSTLADGPVSAAMTRAEFEAYYMSRHGAEGLRALPFRLERAATYGSSGHARVRAAEAVIDYADRGGEDDTANLARVLAAAVAERNSWGLPPLRGEAADEAAETAPPPELRIEDLLPDADRIPDTELQITTHLPDAAVTITHMPTGLRAHCGVKRSQYMNRQVALTMLRAGLAV